MLPLQFEPRDQFEQRQKKLEQIQALGYDPYPCSFRWTDTPAALVEQYSQTPGAEFETMNKEVRVAGRSDTTRPASRGAVFIGANPAPAGRLCRCANAAAAAAPRTSRRDVPRA